MIASFINFSKRKNSTRRPPNNGGLTVDIYFKQNTDRFNPTVIIANTNNVSTYDFFNNYNYCVLYPNNSRARYYFINNIYYPNAQQYIVELSEDCLATYREEIFNTTVFVERAGINYNNNIVDSANTVLTDVDRSILTGSVGDSIYDTGDGCYILQASNALGAYRTTGFNTIYLLTSQQMADVAQLLMTNSDILEELKQIFSAPIDSVLSIHWLPISFDVASAQLGSGSANVWLGRWDSGVTGRIVGYDEITYQETFNLSPYIEQNYKKNGTFTEINLCLPFIGTVGLNTKHLFESNQYSINIRTSISGVSGSLITFISDTPNLNAPFAVFQGNVAQPRSLSQSSVLSVGGVASLATSLISSIATLNPLPFAMSAASVALTDMANPQVQNIGSNAGSTSFLYYGVNNRVIILKRKTAYEVGNSQVAQTIGFPVQKPFQLSSFNGNFVKCVNASVSGILHISELNEVNNMLNGGVYIE